MFRVEPGTRIFNSTPGDVTASPSKPHFWAGSLPQTCPLLEFSGVLVPLVGISVLNHRLWLDQIWEAFVRPLAGYCFSTGRASQERHLSCMVMFLGVTVGRVGDYPLHVGIGDEAGCLTAYNVQDSTSQELSSRVHHGEAEKFWITWVNLLLWPRMKPQSF